MTGFDGPRWGPAQGGKPGLLVLLLHGVGADGDDLIDLAPLWGAAVPDALFIAPHAPDRYDQAPAGFEGRQWFSLADRRPAVLAAGAAAAAPALGALLEAERAAAGLTAGAVALMGFSQGAMMALQLGLRHLPQLAGVLAYSGALRDSAGILARPPVLLVHGEADDIVPVAASQAAEAALRAALVPVEALYRPGLGHGLDDAGLAAGAAFLQRLRMTRPMTRPMTGPMTGA